MKKVFFALAIAAMFSFVACNGNNEQKADSPAPEATETEVAAPAENNDSANVNCAADETADATAEATTDATAEQK